MGDLSERQLVVLEMKYLKYSTNCCTHYKNENCFLNILRQLVVFEMKLLKYLTNLCTTHKSANCFLNILKVKFASGDYS